jgi:hypothetical protein
MFGLLSSPKEGLGDSPVLEDGTSKSLGFWLDFCLLREWKISDLWLCSPGVM